MFWIAASIALYYLFSMRDRYEKLTRTISELLLSCKAQSKLVVQFEYFLSTIFYVMWLQVIYYKINKRSLVNLFAPCHVFMLLQAIILSTSPEISLKLTVLSLTMVTGSALALLFPDTSGLDQPLEREEYWLQHYMIQVIPIYLLTRYDFAALKLSSLESLSLSNFVILVLHWTFYEVFVFVLCFDCDLFFL